MCGEMLFGYHKKKVQDKKRDDSFFSFFYCLIKSQLFVKASNLLLFLER